jgi:Tfp pilus assembly protein PilF
VAAHPREHCQCLLLHLAASEELALLQALAAGGDYKAADEALSRLNRVSSDCTKARLLSAQMYLQEGNFEKCSWEAGRSLKIEPSNVKALLLRGEAFFYLEVLPCLVTVALQLNLARA